MCEVTACAAAARLPHHGRLRWSLSRKRAGLAKPLPLGPVRVRDAELHPAVEIPPVVTVRPAPGDLQLERDASGERLHRAQGDSYLGGRRQNGPHRNKSPEPALGRAHPVLSWRAGRPLAWWRWGVEEAPGGIVAHGLRSGPALGRRECLTRYSILDDIVDGDQSPTNRPMRTLPVTSAPV